MVEFIVILVPLMTLFLSMIELSRLAIAHLLLERAAGISVRACAVIKDQPKNCEMSLPEAGAGEYGESAANQLIRKAASDALRPWADSTLHVERVDCRTQKPSGEDKLELKAQFRCIVPIARDILCSSTADPAQPASSASLRELVARARYAHQGANFDCRFASVQYAVPGASGSLDLPDLGGAWP